MSISAKIGIVTKGLIISYAVTGVLLSLLAFLVYRFGLEENITDLSITAIYVIVTFLGAFFVGKKVKERKFLWGFLLGFFYIVIISLVAIALGQAVDVASTANLSTVALCIGGGLLGLTRQTKCNPNT